ADRAWPARRPLAAGAALPDQNPQLFPTDHRRPTLYQLATGPFLQLERPPDLSGPNEGTLRRSGVGGGDGGAQSVRFLSGRERDPFSFPLRGIVTAAIGPLPGTDPAHSSVGQTGELTAARFPPGRIAKSQIANRKSQISPHHRFSGRGQSKASARH